MRFIDLEFDEETSLIFKSVQGLIERDWSTKKLRKYAEGDQSGLDLIFMGLAEMGVFEFVRSADARRAALLCELIGRKLLPGIAASTFVASRSVRDLDKTSVGTAGPGYPRISFSPSAIVPDAQAADIVVTRGVQYRRGDVELIPIESVDPTMKLFRVTPLRKGEAVDVSMSEALVSVVPQIVGSGDESFDLTANYAKQRIAFGKPIASFQTIKHRLVDDAVAVEFSRSLYLGAADDPSLRERAMIYASKKIPKVITDGIQIHGGIGFTSDIDLHLHLRRVVTLCKLFEVAGQSPGNVPSLSKQPESLRAIGSSRDKPLNGAA